MFYVQLYIAYVQYLILANYYMLKEKTPLF